MSDSLKFRDRKFVAVLYPEDASHAVAIEKLKQGGYNFAAILHDKDVYEEGDHKGELKKPHWHIVLRFKNAVWNTAISKELGITANYLEACKDVDSALLYLVHYGHNDKFQYEYEAVFGPLGLKLATLLADTDEGTRVLNILEIIENSPGPIGYSELLKKAVSAGLYSDLRRMGHFATALIREHNYEVWQSTAEADKRSLSASGFDDFLDRSGDIDFVARCKCLDKAGLPPRPLDE